MYTTTELKLFVHLAETGNLSRAARDLDLQTATASASLKRLERTLACRLFERTTRSMRLTPQGEVFLQYSRDALALLAEGEAALDSGRSGLRGHVRIAAPSDFGRQVLVPLLNQFQSSHPELRTTLRCSDHHSDLFRDPVDMAFRYGRLGDSSLVAHKVADSRRVLVASPAYLAQHGRPASVEQLQRHNCLVHNLQQETFNTWRFNSAKGPLEVKVKGDRIADDGAVVREWAVAGCGIAYKSRIDARADLEAGRLVPLLEELEGEDWPLQVVFPHRASVSPASHALLAFVRGALGPG